MRSLSSRWHFLSIYRFSGSLHPLFSNSPSSLSLLSSSSSSCLFSSGTLFQLAVAASLSATDTQTPTLFHFRAKLQKNFISVKWGSPFTFLFATSLFGFRKLYWHDSTAITLQLSPPSYFFLSLSLSVMISFELFNKKLSVWDLKIKWAFRRQGCLKDNDAVYLHYGKSKGCSTTEAWPITDTKS